MVVNYKIWNFPAINVKAELFHVPGSSFVGGLTSGGARVMSPEPGGRSVLEVTPSLSVCEWKAPFASWIMSKTNGEIFKIKLTKTPQLISFMDDVNYKLEPDLLTWDTGLLWDNGQGWADDGYGFKTINNALEGQTQISVETSVEGEIIKHGHVVGFSNYSYIVDDVDYTGTIANLKLKPPLRRNIYIGENMLMRPYFTGSIANGNEIKSAYDISNAGNITLGKIVFNEVILNV